MLVIATFGVLGIGSDNEFMTSLDGELRCSNVVRMGLSQRMLRVGTDVLIVLHETSADLRTFLGKESLNIHIYT